MSEYKVGDEITIKINGKEVKTVIDENGTQRMPGNWIIAEFWQRAGSGKKYDLNDLAVDFHRGKCTLDEIREFYILLGYSVAGFAELSYFENDEIENPVWEEK